MATCWAKRAVIFIVCAWVLPVEIANAQDVEPRRWTPMPVGINVIGAGYIKTDGDILFDPVSQVEDVVLSSHLLVATYARSMALWGRSARFDAIVPIQSAHWKGLLQGEPASAVRKGFGDPILRMSINLYGAPAMNMDEFRKHTAGKPVSTMIGAALIVTLPLGEYFEDKLLNLGGNRLVLRPQMGVLHTRGKWSFELTGSVFIFAENDDFFGGVTRKQDPVLAGQAHVIRFFERGYWASLSAAYGLGGQSILSGSTQDDSRRNVIGAVSFGMPLTPKQGLKFIYLVQRTNTETGADLDSFGVSWSKRF
jgi:hypothetical protein